MGAKISQYVCAFPPLLRLKLNRQAASNKGSRPQPRHEIVTVWERSKIRLEPGPHRLSPGLAVVPDWLAGGRSRVVWPAGLFPSPAELNSFSALWLAPVWAGTAERVSESWAGPVIAGWGRGSRTGSVVDSRRAAAARGALVKFDAWRALGWGRFCRVVVNWQWAAVRPVPPWSVAPGQVCFLNIVWGGPPWPSCSVTGSCARSVLVCRGPAVGCRCWYCRGPWPSRGDSLQPGGGGLSPL